MDYITAVNGKQVAISVEEVMSADKRYDWKGQKVKTMFLHELYEKAGYPEYAVRVKDCATYLEFGVYKNGERRLRTANFCKVRLCPMCIGRRARRSAWKLSQILNQVEQKHGAMFIFLTLSIRNVPGEKLGEAIGQLTKAWTKLIRHRQFERSIGGWFRAVEITRGDNRWHKDHKTGEMKFREDKGYHPHIHAILAVKPEYFSRKSGLYISHDEWVDRWQKALGVDYRPSVRIQTAKAKGKFAAGKAAAVEAAKYAVKDEEYIDDTLPESRLIEILTDYTEALYKRRLMAFGGWMKVIAKALDSENLEDGDLVHLDDDAIRDDLLEMIVGFNWHFGAGDFILSRREINPFEGMEKERSLRKIEKTRETDFTILPLSENPTPGEPALENPMLEGSAKES